MELWVNLIHLTFTSRLTEFALFVISHTHTLATQTLGGPAEHSCSYWGAVVANLHATTFTESRLPSTF